MAALADLIRGMASAGASPEAIAMAIEAIEATQTKDAERRAKQAERKARSRAKSRDSRVTVTGLSVDNPPDGPPPSLHPSSPPLTPPVPKPDGFETDARADGRVDLLTLVPEPQASRQAPSFDRSARHEFETRFWPAYPHKVGKLAAEAAWLKAAKRPGFAIDAVLSALSRYAAAKPPDRAWCNPATWLNQGRWNDEPDDDSQPSRQDRAYPGRGPFGPRPLGGQTAAILEVFSSGSRR